MFINLIIEGVNPTTATTAANVDSWIKVEKTAFSTFRDPDGSDFAIKTALGVKMTTYIVERATMKIVKKGTPEDKVLPELDTLP